MYISKFALVVVVALVAPLTGAVPAAAVADGGVVQCWPIT
jgi:hypothetical protein